MSTQTLIQEAHNLMESAFDAKYDQKDIAKANQLFEKAAQKYEEAQMPHDAENCRMMKENEE